MPMPQQRRPNSSDHPHGEDDPRYDPDELALPIDTTFYTNTDPQPGAEAATADDAGTSSSSPIDIQRLEAEIAEADRLLSPQGEQEASSPA
jgi:hypothetical protein